MLFGREFHRAGVDVSISRLPYLTVLLRFGTSDVVDEDRNGLAGVYHLNISHMYVGACPCNILKYMEKYWVCIAEVVRVKISRFLSLLHACLTPAIQRFWVVRDVVYLGLILLQTHSQLLQILIFFFLYMIYYRFS